VRVAVELQPLDVDLGLERLVLRLDRGVLAGRHRERAGHQPGHAGQHDRLVGGRGPGEAGDQRDVGDQPVHRPEGPGAQPAAVDVAVRVVVLVLDRLDGRDGELARVGEGDRIDAGHA
jgi:hypothetical protein